MHLIYPFDAEVTLQSFPSTVTVLFSVAGEKPVPDIVRYYPPILPLTGDTVLTVGRAVNSKYYPGLNELLLMYRLLFEYPGITWDETLYFPAS